MSQLTKEYFDKALKDAVNPLATKADLKDQTEELARITKAGFDGVDERLSDQTNKLLSKVALQTDLDDLKNRLGSVESTLDSHTTILDKIAKNTEHWKTELAAHVSAHKRYDRWFEKIADKIGLKLED